ncbi:MAG: DUF1080 domain-containing protein [Allomuricauda sp.]|nr:MAG: DUF1080 domain-containing protein [Allomuricauda sp.]
MKYLLPIRDLAILTLLFVSCKKTQEPWVELIQHESLKGWEVKNGTAEYQLKNGVVIGTTKFGSANTFLCTQEHYDNFILEFEVWVDSTINSGVQFRSNSLASYQNGRVHGYQAEIDPSDRAWSGGIYEEGKRGWLYNLEEHPEGRAAFKNGAWNHYRIEAIDNHLAIWVNHINTANLEDTETASGFIGLQVHSIADETQAGRQIKWKNIRIITNQPDEYITPTTAALIKP